MWRFRIITLHNRPIWLTESSSAMQGGHALTLMAADRPSAWRCRGLPWLNFSICVPAPRQQGRCSHRLLLLSFCSGVYFWEWKTWQ